MNHALLVSSRANADITSAHHWYEERVPGLGADFVRRVDATVLLIQRSPQLFRPRRGKMRMAMTTRFPYAVYFVWDEAAHFISIRRVLCFSQDASAHLER